MSFMFHLKKYPSKIKQVKKLPVRMNTTNLLRSCRSKVFIISRLLVCRRMCVYATQCSRICKISTGFFFEHFFLSETVDCLKTLIFAFVVIMQSHIGNLFSVLFLHFFQFLDHFYAGGNHLSMISSERVEKKILMFYRLCSEQAIAVKIVSLILYVHKCLILCTTFLYILAFFN